MLRTRVLRGLTATRNFNTYTHVCAQIHNEKEKIVSTNNRQSRLKWPLPGKGWQLLGHVIKCAGGPRVWVLCGNGGALLPSTGMVLGCQFITVELPRRVNGWICEACKAKSTVVPGQVHGGTRASLRRYQVKSTVVPGQVHGGTRLDPWWYQAHQPQSADVTGVEGRPPTSGNFQRLCCPGQ